MGLFLNLCILAALATSGSEVREVGPAQPVRADFASWRSISRSAKNETRRSQFAFGAVRAKVSQARRLLGFVDGEAMYLKDFLGGYLGVCSTITNACDGASFTVRSWRNEKSPRTKWVMEFDGAVGNRQYFYLRNSNGGYLGMCGVTYCDGDAWVLYVYPSKRDRCRWSAEISGGNIYFRQGNGYLGTCGANDCGWIALAWREKKTRTAWTVEKERFETAFHFQRSSGGVYCAKNKINVLKNKMITLDECETYCKGNSVCSACSVDCGSSGCTWSALPECGNEKKSSSFAGPGGISKKVEGASPAPTSTPTTVESELTESPSVAPTFNPSSAPSSKPTESPIFSTEGSLTATSAPTSAPSVSSLPPTSAPSSSADLKPLAPSVDSDLASRDSNDKDEHSLDNTWLIILVSAVVLFVICATLGILYVRRIRAREKTRAESSDTFFSSTGDLLRSAASSTSVGTILQVAPTLIRVLISTPQMGLKGEPIMANLEWIGEQTKAIVCAFDRAGAGVTNFGDDDEEKFKKGDIENTKWAASYLGRISGALQPIFQCNDNVERLDFVVIDGGPVTQWEQVTVVSEKFRISLAKEMKEKLNKSISFVVTVCSYEQFMQCLDSEKTIHSEPLLQDLMGFHFAAVLSYYKNFNPYLSASMFKAKIEAAKNTEQIKYLIDWQRAVEEATKLIDDKHQFELQHKGKYEISRDPDLLQTYQKIEKEVDEAEDRIQAEYERAQENVYELFKGMAKPKDQPRRSAASAGTAEQELRRNLSATKLQSVVRGKQARRRVSAMLKSVASS